MEMNQSENYEEFTVIYYFFSFDFKLRIIFLRPDGQSWNVHFNFYIS